MKKIVLVIKDAYSYAGTENICNFMSECLGDEHEVVIYSLEGSGKPFYPFEKVKQIVSFAGEKNPIRSAVKRINQQNFDAVFLISMGRLSVMFALWNLLSLKKKTAKTYACEHIHSLLYTEMVTTGAIIHGKGDYLAWSEEEQPVALQLGGFDAAALAECAKQAEDRGYNEINLNVGCPSDRVQNGRFGACLMAEPTLVADGIKAMRDRVSIPVTVKTRIGIDEQDSYEFLCEFIRQVSEQGGCENFIIHARKAWLSGLSPKENREIPPLDYERVYQLKRDFPHLTISINGGVKSLAEAKIHLQHLDGVMMGREAYQNPGLLAQVDRELFGSDLPAPDPVAVVRAMYPYIEAELATGTYLGHITRHMLGLFQGIPGARQWRRHLSENAHKPGANIETVEQALALVADKIPAAV